MVANLQCSHSYLRLGALPAGKVDRRVDQSLKELDVKPCEDSDGPRHAAKLMYGVQKTIKKSLSIEISKRMTIPHKFCRHV